VVMRPSRRRPPRFAIRVPVVCLVKMAPGMPKLMLRGYTVAISEDGFQVALPRAVRPGSMIELALQTGWGPLLTEGKVIRGEERSKLQPVEADIHHGIRFRRMTPEQRFVFESFFISLIEAVSLREL